MSRKREVSRLIRTLCERGAVLEVVHRDQSPFDQVPPALPGRVVAIWERSHPPSVRAGQRGKPPVRGGREGMPEILDAYKRDGCCFGVVRVTIDGESRTFEFGVTLQSYRALKRILGLRPFGQGLGEQYRYFTGRSRGLPERPESLHVCVEQGRRGKSLRIEVPEQLCGNLEWFLQMRDFAEAKHLRRLDQALG